MQAIRDSTAMRKMNILCDGGESRENVCEQASRQVVVDEDYHLPRREGRCYLARITAKPWLPIET